MKKSTAFRLIAVIAALLLWQTLSMAAGLDMLLASPVQVAQRLLTVWLEKDFLSTVLFSVMRVFLGFILAFSLGTVLGVLSGRFKAAEYLLWPYVVAFKSVPVASFIILCLIWLSSKQLTVFIAFLIAFPVIYGNVLEGIKSTDHDLKEMCSLFKVPWRRRFLYVYLPSVKPYLISACSVAAGMAWKAGVAAEIIGVVKGSIGEKLYEAKIYLQSADLFAWTIIIILLSVIMEKAFLFLLKRAFVEVEKL